MSDDELRDERRRNDTLVLALMTEVRDTLRRLETKVDDHIAEEPGLFKAHAASAFPGGDPDGHRRFHEAEIARREERAQLYRDLRAHLAKWGVVGLLGWLAVVAWQAFLHGPRGG